MRKRWISALLALVLTAVLLPTPARAAAADASAGSRLTGADRETQASKSGRALLRRRTDTVYAISYSAGYDEWSYAVDRSVVEESFKPIEKRWSMGEN